MLSSDSRCRSTARLSSFHIWVLPALLAAFVGQAGAQTAEVAPSERAKRDAEKVFQWIRLHADKPRKATAPAAAPEKPATRVVARPQPKPADTGVTETVAPILPSGAQAVASTPTATSAAQPVTSDAPTIGAANPPAVVAAAPQAAPAAEEEEPALRPIRQSEPEFPAHLMRQLRRGLVQVSFTVEPDGSVSNAKAVSSTHPRLTNTAVATVAQWKFQPLRHAQQGVVDLGFNLD